MQAEGEHWAAPRAAWTLARETAAGRGPAALKEIPAERRPEVLVALAAQARSFLCDAALHGTVTEPDPREWGRPVPHAPVRALVANALAGQPVRLPGNLCRACTAAALGMMTQVLLDVMTDAGVPRRDLPATLDWLAARAR